MGTNIYIASKEDLREIIREIMLELLPQQTAVKVYTINQVAKQLGMAHRSISNLVKIGTIQSTKSGRITEAAINDYLSNSK